MATLLQIILLCSALGCFDLIDCTNHHHPCEARLTAVPTRLNGKAYTAHDVFLYRCSGGDEDKNGIYTRCIDPKPTEIEINLSNANGLEPETVKFHNESKCQMACVCEKNEIKCPGGVVHQPKCERGHTWDKNICECVKNQKLVIAADFDCSKGGSKKSGGGISTPIFIASLIIEFIAVLIIVFLVMDVCKYRKHSKGVIFKTAQYVRQISSGERDFRVTTLKREREATGSISFLYDVNNGNVPNGKVPV